jgi:hypothetical protein
VGEMVRETLGHARLWPKQQGQGAGRREGSPSGASP